MADASTRLLKHGLLVLLVSLFCYGLLLSWLYWRKDMPIDIPVEFSQGHVYRQEFKPNISNAHYNVEVVAQRKLPQQALECLLGISSLTDEKPDGCHGDQALQVFWQVFDGARVIATSKLRSDGGGYSQDDVEKVWDPFPLNSGRRYVLVFRILADNNRLNLTSPRLHLELSGVEYESEVVIAQLSTIFLMFTGGVGFVMTAMGAIRRFT